MQETIFLQFCNGCCFQLFLNEHIVTLTDSLITGCFQDGGWATRKLIIECLLLKSFVTDCALWPRLWTSVWKFVVVCECGGGGGQLGWRLYINFWVVGTYVVRERERGRGTDFIQSKLGDWFYQGNHRKGKGEIRERQNDIQ